ncbi:protoporphyrinogen oxidase HemJ [Candidatus Pelagibacter sp.]|nr:protoporphyrinogen oxidase HemJ [Candidatus Pelagibacter sp.]|tara:strand:- start:1233 stop:1667 length:435 start_codon:yes stop_codon:yes gene_type:complete
MNLYLVIKSLHLIAVISWMAGLLYLPRIFVYHVENFEKKETTAIFETMEKRLYNFIMRPAMLFSWIFGIVLIYIIGFDILSNLWMQIKLALVIFLSAYHEYLGKCIIKLKERTNTKTAKFYRYINEIPTITLILIIFIVIIKPL